MDVCKSPQEVINELEETAEDIGTDEPTDIFEAERKRYEYYSFLRRDKKPSRGSLRKIKFPPIKDDEDVVEYFNRCHEAVGARPSPVGPMRRIPVNTPCNCKSGKKYKKCCGRGA